MANNQKNIVITPNISSTTDDPKIVFSGADSATANQDITMKVYPVNNGTLSFEGSTGQLFSISNTQSGTIYSVNDVSGIPSLEVLDSGTIKFGQYSGNILMGTGTDVGNYKLQVNGNLLIGDLNPISTGAPKAISLGGSYSSVAGANLKLKLYEDSSGSISGFGVSSNQLDYVVPSSVSHVWYGNGTQRMKIASDGTFSVGPTNSLTISPAGTISAAHYIVAAGVNVGYGLWASNPITYGMLMSNSADTTYGGRISGETTSDYNMYFTMNNGTNRGFVFRNAYATPLFAINGDGVRSSVPIITSSVINAGGNISLNNSTSNIINFGTPGVAGPTFTTRSSGTKLVLYDNVGSSLTDYAFGIESNTLWSSVATTAQFFKWYGGTTLAATLTGTGNFTIPGIVTAATVTAGSLLGTLVGSILAAGGNCLQSTTPGTSYTNAIQIREISGFTGSTNVIHAPRLAFHWGGVVASSISLGTNGGFYFDDNPGTSRSSIFVSDVNASNNMIAAGLIKGSGIGSVGQSGLSTFGLGTFIGGDGVSALLYGRNNATWAPMFIDATNIFINTQSGGKVGIGSNSPSAVLHILNAAAATQDIESSLVGGYSRLRLTASGRTYGIVTEGSSGTTVPNKLGIYDYTASAYRLTLDTTGYIGIGTTTPNATLDVRSTIYAGPSNQLQMFGRDSGGTLPILSYYAGASNPFIISTTINNNHIALMPNGTGNVGISTVAPISKLDFGTSAANAKLVIGTYIFNNIWSGIGMDPTTAGIRIAGDPANLSMDVGSYSNDVAHTWTSRMVVRSDTGYVGIKNSSPNADIDIIPTSNNIFTSGLKVQRDTVPSQFGTFNYAVGSLNITSIVNTGIHGSTAFNSSSNGSTTRTNMFIDTTGYIGIGTTTPGDKLEVSGNVFANAFNAIGTAARYYSTGGVVVVGNAGSAYAAIQAYSDSGGTGKILALNAGGGNVGVGLSNPSYKFSVGATEAFSVDASGNSRATTTVIGSGRTVRVMETVTGTTIKNSSGDIGWANVYGFEAASLQTLMGSFGAYGSTKDTLLYYYIGDYVTPKFTVRQDTGNVIIGSYTDNGDKLQVPGTINATTSIKSPLYVGGAASTSSLTLQSTIASGTSDAIYMKVGNNGSITALTVLQGSINASIPFISTVNLSGTHEIKNQSTGYYLNSTNGSSASSITGYVGNLIISNDIGMTFNGAPLTVNSTGTSTFAGSMKIGNDALVFTLDPYNVTSTSNKLRISSELTAELAEVQIASRTSVLINGVMATNSQSIYANVNHIEIPTSHSTALNRSLQAGRNLLMHYGSGGTTNTWYGSVHSCYTYCNTGAPTIAGMVASIHQTGVQNTAVGTPTVTSMTGIRALAYNNKPGATVGNLIGLQTEVGQTSLGATYDGAIVTTAVGLSSLLTFGSAHYGNVYGLRIITGNIGTSPNMPTVSGALCQFLLDTRGVTTATHGIAKTGIVQEDSDATNTLRSNVYLGAGNTDGVTRLQVDGNTKLTGTVEIPDFNDILITNTRPVMSPSLLLDFVNSESIDPRIVCNRTSIATYYDENGTLRYASPNRARINYKPSTGECMGLLVEEFRANYFTYSSSFTAGWGLSNAMLSKNCALAPDGSWTAAKLMEDTVNTQHLMYQAPLAELLNTVYTFSVFAKAGERNIVGLTNFGESYAYFDLVAGTITDTGGGTCYMEYITDGWYRCSWTFTNTNVTSNNFYICLYNGAGAYAGDGKSGFYVWGAQVEVASFPTSYVPSKQYFTSRGSSAYYYGYNGYLTLAGSNVPRMNWNPARMDAPPQLLLESANTNLIYYSEDLTQINWVKSNALIQSNVSATSDPAGTYNADKLTLDTTANYHFVYQQRNGTGEWTAFSVYAKAAEITQIRMVMSDNTLTAQATFDLLAGTGTVTSTNNASYINISCDIQFVGNGWYRCILGSYRTGVNTLNDPQIDLVYSNVVAGDGASGVYIWGAQLENSYYPTSYYPTTSAQTGRAADVYSSVNTGRGADDIYLNASGTESWLNNTGEGTFVTDFMMNYTNPASDRYPGAFTLGDATWTNRLAVSIYPNGLLGCANIFGNVNMMDTGGFGPSNVGVFKTAAISYKLNDIAFSFSGAIQSTDTTVSIYKNMFRLQIGCAGPNTHYLNGHIGRIAYYPKRITNTELSSLTLQ